MLLLCNSVSAQPGQRTWADTLRAKTLLEECTRLNAQEKLEAALEKAKEGFAIYNDLYGAEHVKTAEARMYVAYMIWTLRRDEEAIALFRQSLRTYELLRDTTQMAFCHSNISKCRRSQRRYNDAYQEAQTAIRLLRPDSVRKVEVLCNYKVLLANSYIMGKNYLEAIPILEEVKSTYTALNKAINLGVTSYHLGGAYFGLHDYVRAKEHFLAALDYLLKSNLPRDHSYFPDLWVNIGFCCQRTGDAETGLRYLVQAKEAYQRKFDSDDPHCIAILHDLGEFYLDEGRYAEAAEQFEACLLAKEQRFGARSIYLLATLKTLGETSIQKKQFARAESCFRRGLQIGMDSLGAGNKLAYQFYTDLAALRLAQGDFSSCLALCDSALVAAGLNLDEPEKILPRDYYRELCQLYARSFRGQYQQSGDLTRLHRAEQYFSRAAETLYQEVEEISVHSSREIFYDRDFPVLEEWLDVQWRLYENTGNLDYAQKMFQITGRSKAFLLAESMQRNGALRFAGLPDSILRAEFSLRERIVDAEKMLDASALDRHDPSDSSALTLNRDLAGWRQEYGRLLHRIEITYPEYFRLRKLRQDLAGEALRRKGLAPGQAMLMYGMTQSGVYAFVLTRDTFLVQKLPVSEALSADIDRFRQCLTTYFTGDNPDDSRYDADLDQYISLAQSLYRQLVQPVAPLLPERIVIIPEGKLCHLPFEALLTAAPANESNLRSYPYWAMEKAISYALSPNYWIETMQSHAKRQEKNWLGVAPFASESPAGDGSTAVRSADSGTSFQPLPYSGQEVSEIAAMLEGEVWLNAAARPGRFREEAYRHRILHLATHSRADDRMGHYSYLATSASGERLPAKDLYQLSLAAEMVVLSACESGSGKLRRGEGIIGLVRAFSYAGARSIIATLWVAHDQSATGLMVEFYRRLKQGMPKDLALKAARTNMLKQAPGTMHPFYWAGFRLYGNVAPLW